MRDFYVKEKPFLVVGEDSPLAPDNDAVYGPWDSISEFESWYASASSNSDIPNSLVIGVNQSDGTTKKYEYNKTTGGDGVWAPLRPENVSELDNDAGYVVDDGTLVYAADGEEGSESSDSSSGGIVASSDPYGLQLHCEATEGQMRFIKRARQLTDIKFTPDFDMRRICSSWLGTNRVDIFNEGEEYQGVPYTRIYRSYGHSYLAVGNCVSFDTFATATAKEGSWQNTKSPGGNASISGISNSDVNEENVAAAFFGTYCSGLWAYAFDVKYCYLIYITSTPGFTLESSTEKIGDWTASNLHKHLRLGDTLLNGTLRSGSTTTYTSNPTHVAVITDVYYNEDGTISAVEVSEATTSGRTNYNKKGGKKGGVCRRMVRLTDNFISTWSSYYVIHYSDFGHIEYKPVGASPVGNEGIMPNVLDRPLLPTSGNHFLYKKSWWDAQSFSTVALMPAITGTAKVTNALAGTEVDYACTAGTNISVTGNAVGTYEAYIYATYSDGTSKTVSCTWRVSDASISAVASGNKITFTIACPDDVDIPFCVSFTSGVSATQDPYKNGTIKCSDGTYIKDVVPTVSGNTRTYTFSVNRSSSSLKYVYVSFKAGDFGQWQADYVTIS